MVNWVHDISQSALAGAVLMLGSVILLELRSIARLRRDIDSSLARVFEQLDLLRFESQGQQPPEPLERMREPAKRPSVAAAREHAPGATVLLPTPVPAGAGAPLPAGEARLLASLAEARARRVQAGRT